MEIKKIGEIKFGEFKTEFSLTPRVKEYLENERVSLAVLLPDGWSWFETELFEAIDENQDEESEGKYGKEFEVIYYGIVEGRDLIEGDFDDENSKVKEKGFEDDLGNLFDESFLFSDFPINSTPENPKKKFVVKYLVKKKD